MFNYGFELFVNLFQGVMFTVFCYKFLTPSRNKICEGIAFCVASLLTFLSITQINRLYLSFAYIETVVFFAIMIPYCVLFFKDRIFVKILTPVIFNVIYSVLSLYAPGFYDSEPATVALMHEYAADNGYEIDITESRYHHEIYLSDARRVAQERLKTVIRIPITR